MNIEFVTLRKIANFDVSARLRQLADEIDKDRYGEVSGCAIAVLGNELSMVGYCADSAATSIARMHDVFLRLKPSLVEQSA